MAPVQAGSSSRAEGQEADVRALPVAFGAALLAPVFLAEVFLLADVFLADVFLADVFLADVFLADVFLVAPAVPGFFFMYLHAG